MELPVRLGSAQVTFFEVVPGAPGEGRRLANALRKVAPHVVALDVSFDEARKAREGWFASAVRACLDDHGLRDSDEPAAIAAMEARGADAEIVPLLGALERPGLFVRRRAVRAVTGGRVPGAEPRALAAATRTRVADADPVVKRLLHAGEEAMARRLGTMILDEQRTRVAAVVTYPRSERVAGLLVGKPIAQEVARVAHGLGG